MDAIRRADAFAIANGVDGWTLMQAAGQAVAQSIAQRWSKRPVRVLCGPGNNGGDGFVAAAALREKGWPVRVFLLGDAAKLTGDAARAYAHWGDPAEPLENARPDEAGLVIDALFGAGLARPLEGQAAELCTATNSARAVCVAVDVPSGLDGDRAQADGAVFRADLTVTFHRPKPAHLLEPGRGQCGEIVCVDIGIPDGWRAEIEPVGDYNTPDLWPDLPTRPDRQTHKHGRGRLAVLSGGPSATGAARLAAQAGLRAGSGLVTVLSPKNALLVNAQSLSEVMVRGFDGVEGFLAGLDGLRATAAVLGPGAGVGEGTRELVIAALSRSPALVLDADALTSFEGETDHLFSHLRPGDVLTPHAGEFARLFPDLAEAPINKIEAARTAAERAGCVVVFKGPDTVIAAPDGRVRVNTHATPALATAGTGDVLAGITGAFLAQGTDAFDAASAAVWLHGDAGLRAGEGLIAGDVIAALPNSFAALRRRRRTDAARSALK
ncbi:NAD(P)H-hydrate dehydratase [Hyphobacterium marinum]|uniref:Bifunctional NAD(P)H-hydrate repair enzyme n=1 Tax=Hyphobacterium marinum TaxID=3116574 RepID=A0ABU7M195_9PROT|nr:NAD(P)H-hydrate dehydratase [Hyphobacterium sp. Y6023]MEE2567584.1 NAD(P)H-hydrate dehydratase [Hyphobacterium sp. Y6023]